jgi:hypothetical protein
MSRPYSPAPAATRGTTANITRVSFQEIQARMATAPSAWTTKRSSMEMFTVTAFWITVVSEARRLVSSPVRCRSKKPIS